MDVPGGEWPLPDRLGLSGPEGFGEEKEHGRLQCRLLGQVQRAGQNWGSMELMALGKGEGPRMAIRRDPCPLIVKGCREDILGPSVSSEVWRGLASGPPGKCKGGSEKRDSELEWPKHPKPGTGKGRLRAEAEATARNRGQGRGHEGGTGRLWLRMEDYRGTPDRVNATHNRTAEGLG